MSATTKVSRQDIRKIIFDRFNDSDVRFSNDEILGYLNEIDSYKNAELDVLDLEDVLLEMEKSGLLRPIAQNFNTRYYRLWGLLENATCRECGILTFMAQVEDEKLCPHCRAKI